MASGRMAPVSSDSIRSPASRPSSSRESAHTKLALLTTSRSISVLNRKLDPAAFTCVPGLGRRLLCGVGGLYLHPDTFAHLLGEGLARTLVAAVDDDPFEVAYGRYCLELALGLPA